MFPNVKEIDELEFSSFNNKLNLDNETCSTVGSEYHHKTLILGKGAFGTVTLKQWRNMNVAVKTIKNSAARNIIKEAHHLNICNQFSIHENVLYLVGIVKPKQYNEASLVTEFCCYNSLPVTLHKALCVTPNIEFLENDLDYITLSITKGLLHIHSCGILHNDLHLGNIFLRNAGCQKISAVIGDFGLSSTFSTSKPYNIAKDTPEYFRFKNKHLHIAPEVICNYCPSVSSDIFSYGVILKEVAFHFECDIHKAGIQKLAKTCSDPSRCMRPNSMAGVLQNLKNYLK